MFIPSKSRRLSRKGTRAARRSEVRWHALLTVFANASAGRNFYGRGRLRLSRTEKSSTGSIEILKLSILAGFISTLVMTILVLPGSSRGDAEDGYCRHGGFPLPLWYCSWSDEQFLVGRDGASLASSLIRFLIYGALPGGLAEVTGHFHWPRIDPDWSPNAYPPNVEGSRSRHWSQNAGRIRLVSN